MSRNLEHLHASIDLSVCALGARVIIREPISTEAQRIAAFDAFDLGTKKLLDMFVTPSAPEIEAIDDIRPALDHERLEAVLAGVELEAEAMEVQGFTIITPFYAHLDYFVDCAASVREAVAATAYPVEWVVCNDDPSIANDRLEASMDAERIPHRIVSDGVNRGIVTRLNQGIELAAHQWIVFLDCDDLLEPATFDVLASYIEAFPQCRYISSNMLDIDAHGEILRYRLRTSLPNQLFAKGMIAGHLKAIRADLFEDLGMHKSEFSGCQDYELAIRTAIHEPILFIPEFLYRYRWHGGTQSVSRALDQELITQRILTELSLKCFSGDG